MQKTTCGIARVTGDFPTPSGILQRSTRLMVGVLVDMGDNQVTFVLPTEGAMGFAQQLLDMVEHVAELDAAKGDDVAPHPLLGPVEIPN